jgi:putative ABC transport system permease protein
MTMEITRQRSEGMLERLGRWIYQWVLVVVPRPLRRQVQTELLSTFAAGQRHVYGKGGVAALAAFTIKELCGLFAMGVNARRRDRWGASATPRGPSPSSMQPVRGPRRTLIHLLQDVRFAVRNIARRPAAMLLAVFTLALGIGASSAMFSVVDTVLLRPLPYPDPEQVVSVYPTIPEWRGHQTLNAAWDRVSWSYPEFVDWRQTQTSFEMGAVVSGAAHTLTGTGEPERINTGRASHELFIILGVSPALGRLFTPEDDNRTGERVTLLSAEFWRSRFGADPEVVGRTIRLSDEVHTVIGVLPDGFEVAGYQAVLWTPVGGPADEQQRGNHNLKMIARLRDGASIERAQAETEQSLLSQPEPDHVVHGANVVPRLQDVTRDARAPLLILVASSLLVLVVACGNVAALLLGVGIEREQELAVRGALGAGRSRLMGQLLTESIVLAVIGGVVGIVLAGVATEIIVSFAPADAPRLDEVGIDGRVLGFGVVMSGLSGLLLGLMPALSFSRTSLVRSMQASRAPGVGRSRLQAAVVAGEMAVATVLLVGAGLLTRTLMELNAVEPGFQADGLASVLVSPDFQRFDNPEDERAEDAAVDAYMEEIRADLAAIPGVRDVAIASSTPFGQSRSNNYVELEGYEPAEGELLIAERYFVSANYLEVLQTRLLEGRHFAPADDRPDAAPVVLVNEELARHAWPNESAIGKRLSFWGGDLTIVGVVEDMRDRNLSSSSGLQYYVPRQFMGGRFGAFVIRAEGDLSAVMALVRDRIWSVDPDLPVRSVLPLTERMRESLAQQRLGAQLMLAFSGVAVFLALLGVYGVTARTVAWRTREMGIRVALGAEQSSVMAMILRQGVRLALIGTGVGMLLSFGVTRVLESALYGTEPTDPLTLLLVAVAVGVMSLIASLPSSIKATRVDPMVALRAE